MRDVNVYLCAVGLQGFLFYKRSPNIPKFVIVYSLIAEKKKEKSLDCASVSFPGRIHFIYYKVSNNYRIRGN